VHPSAHESFRFCPAIVPVHNSSLSNCLQALESGAVAAVWTQCTTCTQQVIGRPRPQVLSCVSCMYRLLLTQHYQACEQTVPMHLLFRLHASVEAEHVQHSKVNEGVSIFASILIYLRYRLEKEIEQLQQQKDSINRQRKLSQESDGKTLQQMEQQYTALVAKNMEINMACQELESEVSELQEETGQSDASSHDT